PVVFLFSSRRRHTRSKRDWSSDVCSSDLTVIRATPDGFFVSENTYEVSIPSSLNNWLAWCPKMSLPVLQMKETLPPRRATVTARSEERRVGKEWRARCRPEE